MSSFILLDAGSLGLLAHPRNSREIDRWSRTRAREGFLVTIPEIIRYEVRRELLRAKKQRGLRRLDVLANVLYYLPLSTEAMERAAEFWAEARQLGRPTASPEALDVDVILAAQATILAEKGHTVVVATENVGHLVRFVDARPWQEVVGPDVVPEQPG